MGVDRKPGVQSVSRTLDLLEALAGQDEQRLSELAKATGLRPSTAHRLLSALVERDYVVRSATTGRYLLGDKLRDLAGTVDERMDDLKDSARKHLERVHKVTRQSASLTILEFPNVRYVDQVLGDNAPPTFTPKGALVPAHATAAGKSMLAHIGWQVTAEMLGSDPLPAFTPQTITSTVDLEKELSLARHRGYALDNDEQRRGVSCVAAPVATRDGTIVAALSVIGTTPRLRATGRSDVGELLRTCAAELSQELDFAIAS